MSAPLTISDGLPAVGSALEPKWVRDGSASTQKAYESALAFEQTLVEQLSQSLIASSGLGGASGEGAGASAEGESEAEGSSQAGAPGSSELAALLPQGLTSSVMSAGGLGLAAQMTHELEGVRAGAHIQPGGGTKA